MVINVGHQVIWRVKYINIRKLNAITDAGPPVSDLHVVHVNYYIFVVKIAKYNLGRTINKCATPLQP